MSNPWSVVRELLEGLEDKRLAHGDLWDEHLGCGCVMGMIAPRAVMESAENSFWDGGPEKTVYFNNTIAAWAEPLGIDPIMIITLENINDRDSAASPEARYVHVLQFVKDKELAAAL